MEIFWILYWVFLAGIVLLLILSAIFAKTRSTKVEEGIGPSLQSIYDQGNSENSMIVTQNITPFRITSSNRVQPIKDAMRFGTSVSLLATPFGTPQQVGFSFHSLGPMQITGVQYAPQLAAFPLLARTIGIFDLKTQTILASVITNPTTDTLQNGFLTHVLETPVQIESFHSYGVGGIVLGVENSFSFDQASYSNELVIEGSCGTPNTTVFGFPQIFGAPSTIQNFFSFQTQLTNVLQENIFSIDSTVGGYPTMPPGFIRGMNVSTSINGLNVVVENGMCLSDYSSANIILPVPISLSAITGLNGLDTGVFETNKWYNVFVIGSSTLGLNPAGVMSLNAQAPSVFPTGYDTSRRLGVVRWLGTSFDPMQQNGDGPTRTTFYSTANHVFANINGPTDYLPVSLQFVPPTAIAANIHVIGSMDGVPSSSGLGPRNGLVRYRTIGSLTEGIWTSSFQDDPRATADTDVVLLPGPLPLGIEIRVFAGPNGFIPDDPTNPNIGQFDTSYEILSYDEAI